MTYITKTSVFYALYIALVGILILFLYNSLLLLAICLFLSFNIFVMTLAAYTKRAVIRLGKPLFEDCDPGPFINACHALIAKHPKYYFLRILLSSGLLATGKSSEALDNLRLIPEKWIKQMKFRKVIYEEALFGPYLQLDELEEAEKKLFILKELIRTLRKAQRESAVRQYEIDERILKTAKGDYIGAEPFFRGLFERAETNYERVMAKYNLGRTYKHEGDKLRAQIAFDYVPSRGNKLYAVQKARELIQSMNEDSSAGISVP